MKITSLSVLCLAFMAWSPIGHPPVNRSASSTHRAPAITRPASANVAATTGLADTAAVPPEIEDPRCLGINKQPFHATLMPYASLKEALSVNRHASGYSQSLNGVWKFNY